MSKIVVVDLGTGNLRSVAKAVTHVADNHEVVVSHLPEVMLSADKIVLPGQGAIGTWMKQLEQEHIREAIDTVLKNKPVLGICLGLQALFTSSTEYENQSCLDLWPGSVEHFAEHLPAEAQGLSIPHMGWNNVYQSQAHALWNGIDDGARFYFVHSYFAQCENKQHLVGRCDYGISFTAAAAHENIFAVQFHPEKSQHDGLKLIENFVNWNI
ncbi:MAG: imidazole glycerol phosphate synthase subunit HisH [Arenicellales bacterium]